MMKSLITSILVASILPSCLTRSASYVAPSIMPIDRASWSSTIDRPYDEVWAALVDHASGTFFSIDNFEKDSGLMTLSFGASRIDQFVDGGHWTYKETRGIDPVTGQQAGRNIDFEGNYVSFIERHHNARLTGSMNIFVRDLGQGTTEVKVRARYIVSLTVAAGVRSQSYTWSFDTGGSDTVRMDNPLSGLEPTRTLVPTHVAEQTIIRAIREIGENQR